MIRRAAAAVVLVCLSLSAGAAEPPPLEVFRPQFRLDPGLAHLAALERYAKPQLAKANAAGRPAQPRVALLGGTTLISLESLALCDRVKGCPLLVFRDITKRPVLVTTSFQNVMIEVKGSKTTLVLRDAGPDRECVISTGMSAKCRIRQSATK
jgi:hypothetical protein